MSKTRLELKVGLFVAVGLVLLAVLMIQFSKGKALFRQSYRIHLNAPSVAGLQKGAKVLLAGVPVGNVGDMDLGPEGTNVVIDLHILDRYVIHRDADFVIEQSGFLGDQYVAIRPMRYETPPAKVPPALEEGDTVHCPPPFDLKEAAREAADFLKDIGKTAQKLDAAVEKADAAIDKLRQDFLNDQTLSNLAETASSLRKTSDEAHATVQNVNALVVSNRAPIGITVSNLVSFSDKLDAFAVSANVLIDTNSPALNEAIRDIRESTKSLRNLLNKAESGDNLATAFLADEELAHQVSQIASNLSVTTSNLNERGLWGILWKKKHPKPTRETDAPEPLRSPGDPFR
jgi:phospholipid/cholesterol/gamma-HCH transport system substrate-binding protein